MNRNTSTSSSARSVIICIAVSLAASAMFPTDASAWSFFWRPAPRVIVKAPPPPPPPVVEVVQIERPPQFFEINENVGDVAMTLPVPEYVVRRSFGRLDTALIRDAVTFEGKSEITMQLFSDVSLIAEIDRIEMRGENDYTWFGRVDGEEMNDVILTVVDGAILGSIWRGDKEYRIMSNSQGDSEIREIDATKRSVSFASDCVEIDEPPAEESADSTTAPGWSLWPSGFDYEVYKLQQRLKGVAEYAKYVPVRTQIDIAIFYSEATYRKRIKLWGETGGKLSMDMNLYAQRAVDHANEAFLNSGIAVKLNLVGVRMLEDSEIGDGTSSGEVNYDTLVTRLVSNGDGWMDEVHSWRNTWRADLVALYVDSVDSRKKPASGISSASGSFSVVQNNDFGDDLVFTHEIGHNLGAHHDWYVQSSDPQDQNYFLPDSYNHGFSAVSKKKRTIMAYSDECEDQAVECYSLRLFSSPERRYDGFTMGVPSGEFEAADNARAINENRHAVAALR